MFLPSYQKQDIEILFHIEILENLVLDYARSIYLLFIHTFKENKWGLSWAKRELSLVLV